jgi:hypothetical protein
MHVPKPLNLARLYAAKQHENDEYDQDGADKTDTSMTIAISVAAESATEAAQQEDYEDDDKDETNRHDVPSM